SLMFRFPGLAAALIRPSAGNGPGPSRLLVGVLLLQAVLTALPAFAQGKPRARDLGIPFEGKPGRQNAITDVRGVEVGHVTLIAGKGRLRVGKGPVRTGVTAIVPRGKKDMRPVLAGWFSLNGNGEMTGITWVQESGRLEGPILTTNTYSVGTVRDGVLAWLVKQFGADMVDHKLGEDFGALAVQRHIHRLLDRPRQSLQDP